MNSAEEFAAFVKDASYKGKMNAPLCNITFFLGAGFSKSWDEQFPIGNDLFELQYDRWDDRYDILDRFLDSINYSRSNLTISPSLFKDLVYQLGMFKKYPTIRPRYLDNQNIAIIEEELRSLIFEKFKETAPLYYCDSNTLKLNITSPTTSGRKNIVEFFSRFFFQESDGSEGVSQGLRAHIITTNYDFTIDAILDRCFGEDELFTSYIYRGITSKLISGKPNPCIVHNHWLVGNLLKINGGFEIFKGDRGYEIDYRERDITKIKHNPPQIMLPSREQDYLQDYFQAIFPKAIRLLHETSVLVIVGYSLPEEDALIRLILKQFAEDQTDGVGKIIFYVDLADTKKQIQQIKGVFPHTGNEPGLRVIPYSGKFTDWVRNCLKKMDR